nr:T9SS type A sorting domain-containing protein [Pseudarcicella sp.]
TTGFTKVVNAGGIYSATCTESGCLPSASGSVSVRQCDLTSPKAIGTKFGNQVLAMKWGNAIAITEVVEEDGQTRFYPRGKDFFNFWMDKYHHSDELFACINTSVSAGNGMAMPLEVSTSQAGYTLGTKPDGAKYFVANNPDLCAFWVEKHIAKQNGNDVVIKNFGGIKSIATINNMDGRKAYFPRGVNFLTEGLSNTNLNIQLDANFNASILGCLNGEQTAWWGLAPIQALSESATLPNGFQNGYGMINGELHWYIYSPTGARLGVKENVSTQPMALKATPNPAENQMKATYTLQNDQNVWFSIIDNQGKSKLMENVQGKKGINTKTFELSNFTKGIYFLNLQSGSQKETIKVIKK